MGGLVWVHRVVGALGGLAKRRMVVCVVDGSYGALGHSLTSNNNEHSPHLPIPVPSLYPLSVPLYYIISGTEGRRTPLIFMRPDSMQRSSQGCSTMSGFATWSG